MIKIIWDQDFKGVYKRKVKNNDEYKKKFWDAFFRAICRRPFNIYILDLWYNILEGEPSPARGEGII